MKRYLHIRMKDYIQDKSSSSPVNGVSFGDSLPLIQNSVVTRNKTCQIGLRLFWAALSSLAATGSR
jgi:hypothetical protein